VSLCDLNRRKQSCRKPGRKQRPHPVEVKVTANRDGAVLPPLTRSWTPLGLTLYESSAGLGNRSGWASVFPYELSGKSILIPQPHKLCFCVRWLSSRQTGIDSVSSPLAVMGNVKENCVGFCVLHLLLQRPAVTHDMRHDSAGSIRGSYMVEPQRILLWGLIKAWQSLLNILG